LEQILQQLAYWDYREGASVLSVVTHTVSIPLKFPVIYKAITQKSITTHLLSLVYER